MVCPRRTRPNFHPPFALLFRAWIPWGSAYRLGYTTSFRPVSKEFWGTLRIPQRSWKLFTTSLWTGEYLWSSFDVVGLYSCIPHALALEAVSFHLGRYGALPTDLREFILSSIEYLLTHNCFYFDGQFYLQIDGAPMEDKFSLSLSNLYMAWWEERHVFLVENLFRDATVWYWCYIDDLLLVWDRGVAPVPAFWSTLTPTRTTCGSQACGMQQRSAFWT